MKRLFNYRPLLSMFLFMMAGIIFSFGIYLGTAYGIILAIASAIALVSTFVLKMIFVKEHKKFKVISICVLFAIGSLLSVLNIEIYNHNNVLDDDYFISGKVSDRSYYTQSGEKIAITIDDAEIVNVNTLEISHPRGKIKLYLTVDDGRGSELEMGDKIAVYAHLSSIKLFYKGSANFNSYVKSVYTNGFGLETDLINLNASSPSLLQKFKNHAKDILDDNLSPVYSELGYTMLFGDRAGLSDEIEENYFSSGIGHLLAVSGLHIGFVVTLLSLLLAMFKANAKVRFAIIVPVVFIYAMICSFSVSVTRAFVMTTVLLFFQMRHRESDSLSSLAVAGMIVLLINPLQIFTLGFQSSFGSVAGILLLAKPLKVFFDRFFFNKVSSALSVSLSASIGLLPFSLLALSRLSIFSVITNVIVIPIASIAFMVLFSVLLLAMIIPVLGKIAIVFEILMKIVTGISQLTGALSLAGANPYLMYAFSASFILFALFLSDNLFVSKKAQTALTLSFAGLSLVLISLCILI